MGGPKYLQRLLSYAAYLRFYQLQKSVKPQVVHVENKERWKCNTLSTSYQDSCWQANIRPLVGQLKTRLQVSSAPVRFHGLSTGFTSKHKICILSQVSPNRPGKGKSGLFCFSFLNFLTVCLHGRAEVQTYSTWWWYLSSPEIILRHIYYPSQLIFLKTQMFTGNFPSNWLGRNNNNLSLSHIYTQMYRCIE